MEEDRDARMDRIRTPAATSRRRRCCCCSQRWCQPSCWHMLRLRTINNIPATTNTITIITKIFTLIRAVLSGLLQPPATAANAAVN